MKVKEFLGSGPAGIAAGALTLLLGAGAVVALAMGGFADQDKPIGDARLSSANQAFGTALVANAGGFDPAGVTSSGARMADGSPVAGPASSAYRASGAGDLGSTSDPATSPSSAAAERAVPGSAEYYRAILTTAGVSGGLGTLAMLPRGAFGRGPGGSRLAGDLTGARSGGLTRDRDSSPLSDPLVPSRAFSGYGANDAGSSSTAASSSGSGKSTRAESGAKPAGGASRPAIGTSPVGPVAASGNPAVPSAAPATIAAPPVAPALPAAAAAHGPSASTPSVAANPPFATPAASVPLVSSPAPVVTDPLGEHASPTPPAAGGDVAHQPGPPPATPPGAVKPPSTSVVAPAAVVTPEPATWLLVGSGLVVLALLGRRRAGRAG